MANPRKFSEKIALHTHRQAEETARFEQIMREVSDATAKDEEPNVNPVIYRYGSRPRSPGGPIRRPHDRRLDTSPYSSNVFLSPPHDTNWRRTHSDSALHQSAMQDMNRDRGDNCNNGWMMQNIRGPDRNDGRPRSSCEIPRVPGIHIYPSANIPGTLQIPISNNTGSLPDLSNVDFPSPIHVPLDQDQDQGSSPYSSNHLSVPRYSPHPSKNVPIDNKNMTGSVEGDFTQLNNMAIYQQQCSPTSSSPTLQQASGYRSPRPSPQSSPSLGGRHSAPCSPGAPSPLPNDYNIFNQHQANQFQQHFEQLSMLDTPVSTMSYVEQPSSQLTQSHPQSLPEVSAVGSIELTSDPGYYSTSPSQLVYPTAPPSLHTTPNTPTIILTDFSSASEEMSRDDFTKQLENEFFSEESLSLRESLEPLDFDELQMLSDPTMNLISDNVEDGFKMHRS